MSATFLPPLKTLRTEGNKTWRRFAAEKDMTQYDQRITTYFGDSVLRAGFMPVPHLLMRHYHKLGLSAGQAMFVLQIMESNWDLGEPPRTVGALAQRMGVDTRTIRKYTEEVRRLGLIRLYDQFDDRGAQVENGYDLSPLFQRIAALASEQKPPAASHRREPRLDTYVVATAANEHALPPALAAANNVLLTPGANDQGGPDSPCRPEEDPPFLGTVIMRAGLNTESKTTEKTPTKKDLPSQPHLPSHPGDRYGGRGRGIVDGQEHVGQCPARSLRWDVPLEVKHVDITRELLDQFGMKRSVATVVAPTLHPAEAWALWVYARGARLTPGWIAKQIYDFQRRQPRIADISSRYDDVGRSLAALDPVVADQVVELIGRYCPNEPDTVIDSLEAYDKVSRKVAGHVWSVMAELRGGAASLPIDRVAGDRECRAAANPAVDACSVLWASISDTLRSFLSGHEWETWVRACTLLDIHADVAVVGTPNTFVRDEVAARYSSHIAELLTAEVGRCVAVEVVIGQGALA